MKPNRKAAPRDVNQNAFRVIQEAVARAEEPPNRPLRSVPAPPVEVAPQPSNPAADTTMRASVRADSRLSMVRAFE